MKLRTLALLGAAGWLYSQGPRDPREWGAFLGEHLALAKDQAREAVEAGKQAAVRREAQLDAEVRAVMGQGPQSP